jgi:hypothetical protein
MNAKKGGGGWSGSRIAYLCSLIVDDGLVGWGCRERRPIGALQDEQTRGCQSSACQGVRRVLLDHATALEKRPEETRGLCLLV